MLGFEWSELYCIIKLNEVDMDMKTLRFKWDPAKAEMNVKQHGVSFEEAQTVFYDEFAVEFYDDEHEVINMKAEYDLSKMKSRRNPIRCQTQTASDFTAWD